jgi:hypothetical protein
MKQSIVYYPDMMKQITLVAVCCLGACKEQATWFGEGTEGNTCFPDNTCDDGLRCENGRCVRGQIQQDSGPIRPDVRPPSDSSLADAFQPPDQEGCGKAGSPPTLGDHPNETDRMLVAIKGTATGMDKVAVFGGAATQYEDIRNGSFCVLVKLKANVLNRLQIVSIDAKGCYSKAALANVTQVNQAQSNILLNNVAVKEGTSPEQGDLAELTDGNLTKIVKYSFVDPTPQPDLHADIIFNLQGKKTLEKVVVRYPKKGNFTSYLSSWDLLISLENNPQYPARNSKDWKVVKDSDTGTSNDLEISIPNTEATHFALFLYQDGTTAPNEYFEITEIEAYSLGKTTPPPTCP